MARLVALDWDDHEARLVFANQRGDSLTVEDAVAVPLSGETSEDQQTEIGQQLSRVVSDRRYRSADTLATIRRADVELRLLSLPNVPDNELPEIVRFQALREFSQLSDDWPIDFYPMEKTGDNGDEQSVLAAAISPGRLKQHAETIELADLKPQSIVLRPCAAAALVHAHAGDDQRRVQLMADDSGETVELTVLRDHTPTFMRTVQLPSRDDQDRVPRLAAEVRRTIVAARNQLAGDDVEQVILFGSGTNHRENCSQMQKLLDLPVQSIDPFQAVPLGRKLRSKLPANAGRFAAALGLLVPDSRERQPSIDFLNPRKAVLPATKRKLVVATSIAAAVVLLICTGLYWWQLSRLDGQMVQLQKDARDLKQTADVALKRIEEVVNIQEWTTGDVNWLEQLRDVSQKLPAADQLRVRQWQSYITPDGKGQLVMEGLVDQQSTIGQMERNLVDADRQVRGEGGTEEQQDQRYPWRFKETITIEMPGPDPRFVRAVKSQTRSRRRLQSPSSLLGGVE